MGCRAVTARVCGRLVRSGAVVRRQHLLPITEHPRVLGASVRAGDSDFSDLPGDEEPDPLLQPAFSIHLRSLGPWSLPPRQRAHRRSSRRVRRRVDLCVRAVPDSSGQSPPGALLSVDAVYPLRLRPLPQYRTPPRARRRSPRTAAPGPLVRLLPRLLFPVCRRLCGVGAGSTRTPGRPASVGRPHPGCARRRHCPHSVPHGLRPDAVEHAAESRHRGGQPLLRGCLRLPDVVPDGTLLGTDSACGASS